MYLKDYFSNLKKEYQNYFFSGIASNTSQVKKNFIFFAIKGNNNDGHNFIKEAIKKGSKIIIYEKKFSGIKNNILYLNSKNIRKSVAETSFKINRFIPKNLVAVTGTNGKSSIADFYFQILKLNKKKVASIGTLGIKQNNSFKPLSNTTIDPIQLSYFLIKLRKKKVNNVIMEASSHGLKQHRLDGLLFNTSIFSNLSHDHLDYHKNLKNYLNSKLYLFEKLTKKNGNVITDESIPQFRKIKKICNDKKLKLSFLSSKKKISQFQVKTHNFNGERQLIELTYKKMKFKFMLNLIGKVQLKNVLMAAFAAEKSGIKIKEIFNSLYKIKPIHGRFERIGKINNNSKVILDYAHTPDALKTVLRNIQNQFLDKKISIVFGCGGNRDKAKRKLMGKIANSFCHKIYLTDDNPRNENPKSIRNDIKKGIYLKKILEIPDRKKAIYKSISDLKSGEIVLVAGKGHEKTQIYKNKVRFFSDKEIILKSIKKKNQSLSKKLKLNIIKDLSATKISFRDTKLRKVKINSKEVNKNDIFFTLKGKKKDAHRYLSEVFKRRASLAIVNKINKKLSYSKQIKVKNTLKFLIDCAKNYRLNLDTKIIAITGSCGKTSLKDLLSQTLDKSYKISYSPKSYNNKYGVPLSLLNLNQKDIFGILEVGMDKKGEIDFLSKIIKPDIGVITNISSAHIKNFKNISEIASAKGEIINNIKENGSVVLNADDKFYDFHLRLAKKKKLKVYSFSLDKKNTNVNLKKIIRLKNKYKIILRINSTEKFFYIREDFTNLIYNILASITIIQIYVNIDKFTKNQFLNIRTTQGRGDIEMLRMNEKKIFLVDESYNSNPLSLSSALQNFDKIKVDKNKKHIILGDMLELGKHSLRLHKDISQKINNISVNKVHVIGKDIKETFKKINLNKQGTILNNDSEINDLIKQELRNGDYLMIKGSNSTGLFNFVSKLKKRNNNVL